MGATSPRQVTIVAATAHPSTLGDRHLASYYIWLAVLTSAVVTSLFWTGLIFSVPLHLMEPFGETNSDTIRIGSSTSNARLEGKPITSTNLVADHELTETESNGKVNVDLLTFAKENTVAERLLTVCEGQAYASLLGLRGMAMWSEEGGVRFSHLFASDAAAEAGEGGLSISVEEAPMGYNAPPGFVMQRISPVCRHKKSEDWHLLLRTFFVFASPETSTKKLRVDGCAFEEEVAKCYERLKPSSAVAAHITAQDRTLASNATAIFLENLRARGMGRRCEAATMESLPTCAIRRMAEDMMRNPPARFVVSSVITSLASVVASAFHSSRGPLLLAATSRFAALCDPKRRLSSGAASSSSGLHAVQCAQLQVAELFLLSLSPRLIIATSSSYSNFIISQASALNPNFKFLPSLCSSPCPSSFLELPFAKHMIIDERMKVLYCALPKVGNTSWKLWFRAMKLGGNVSELITSNSSQVKRIFERIHDSSANGIDELTELSEARAIFFATRRDVFKFTFVRNPFTRIVSAFLDKIVFAREFKAKGDARLQWVNDLFGRTSRVREYLKEHPNGNISFAQFVDLTEEALQLPPVENHIDFQVDLCALNSIKYDFVGRFEQMSDDVDVVMRRLQKPRLDMFATGLSMQSTHSDALASKLYTQDLYSKVKQMYAKDLQVAFNGIAYSAPKAIDRLFQRR